MKLKTLMILIVLPSILFADPTKRRDSSNLTAVVARGNSETSLASWSSDSEAASDSSFSELSGQEEGGCEYRKLSTWPDNTEPCCFAGIAALAFQLWKTMMRIATSE